MFPQLNAFCNIKFVYVSGNELKENATRLLLREVFCANKTRIMLFFLLYVTVVRS